MQLDAEEDDQAFYKPPVEAAARLSGETSVDAQAAGVATTEDD